MSKEMTIQRAKADNCTDKRGHLFIYLATKTNARLKNAILTKYPQMRGIGLWQCTNCDKVTASM